MDYAGNSNKAKEAEEKPEVPKKELEKIVTGEVVERKKGMGHKFRTLFFGDDFRGVMSFVYEERIIPGLKNLMYDGIIGGVERTLYGQRQTPRGHQHPGMRPRVSYDKPSRRPDPRPSGRLPHQPPAPYRQNTKEANDIVLTSRDEAQRVLDTMVECVEKYEVVSLADLYELVGLPQSTIDQKWGWTYLTSAEVRQIRDGYVLELPPMEEI